MLTWTCGSTGESHLPRCSVDGEKSTLEIPFAALCSIGLDKIIKQVASGRVEKLVVTGLQNASKISL